MFYDRLQVRREADLNSQGELREKARILAHSPYLAIPRISLDLGLWAGAIILATRWTSPWITLLAIAFIGAIPLHDLLVHGHDSTHRLVSRVRRLNEFFLWLNHAFVGISGTAYRTFHLDHHRYTQS